MLPSSLITLPDGQLDEPVTADPAGCWCLGRWLEQIPDHRSHLGRWHPLVFVVALAVCAFTAGGHDSVTAVAEWAAGCDQATLALLGGRRDLFSRRYRAPSAATFARVLGGIDVEALDAAVGGYLAERAGRSQPPPSVATAGEREQRRARKAAEPAADAADKAQVELLPAYAADGKAVRGARRDDGRPVMLLAVMEVPAATVRAQRQIPAKRNEIPELPHAIAHLDLIGAVLTADALHTQRETARHLVEDKHAHYLMIAKGNQPGLRAAVAGQLSGPDSDFAGATDVTTGRGHGRRERRTVRTAPATGIDWPHAGQVFRIRRDAGELDGPWTSKQIVYGITDMGAGLAGPEELGRYARNHWGIENRTHYVRDQTLGEDASQIRTGHQPHALAAVRNLVIGALRLAGYANIAHARRHHGRDERRILDLYEFGHQCP